jgi:signal transduction histidine kinase
MPVEAPSESSASAVAQTATDALWLATLNRIAAVGAHELKGALNGVAVNLEVVRSRADRPDVAASAVSTFANAAVDQLDGVIEMSEGLLWLSRQAAGLVDIGRVVRSVGSLLVRAARADGREIVIDSSFETLGVTTAHANAVRLAIGSVLLAATGASSRVECRAAYDGDLPSARVDLSGDNAPMLAEEMLSAVHAAGIRVQAERSAISITFPR